MKYQKAVAVLIKQRTWLSWTLNISMVLIAVLHSIVLSVKGSALSLPAWWYGLVLTLAMLCLVRGHLQRQVNAGDPHISDADFGFIMAMPVILIAGLSIFRTLYSC